MMNSREADKSRDLHGRPHIGLTAHVVQGNALRITRAHLDRTAFILVDRGIKSVSCASCKPVRAEPGQAILLHGGQTVDFTNTIESGGVYEARWLLFENALILDEGYQREARKLSGGTDKPAFARVIRRMAPAFRTSFETARAALSPHELPDAIARMRVLEVMYWLLEHGMALRPQNGQPGVAARIRHLVSGKLEHEWSCGFVGEQLSMSQATLRRRLSSEGTSLTELLVDIRMAAALAMLQATTRPVADIALSVGYESPSRFSVRFRERFGFPPSAVRGHHRPAKTI